MKCDYVRREYLLTRIGTNTLVNNPPQAAYRRGIPRSPLNIGRAARRVISSSGRRYYITKLVLLLFFFGGTLRAQFATYNHPELEWLSFETEHFEIHYHKGAEWTAGESAKIAEAIYGPITDFYHFQPREKTDLIIKDVDDISNGAAYYYDNKIEIWATPLDFPLRGNHSWLRDVITHEFAHIVSLRKAMKFSKSVPASFLQVIDYEDEKREDVVYGYPRVIVSYPLPNMVMPMWLAEGMAQYMYPDASNDFWDSHRDMLLRDRVLHHKVLSLDQMGSFGKRGIGNESVYNQGYAFVQYLCERCGPQVIPELSSQLSRPTVYSIRRALKAATGIPADQLYTDWLNQLETRYLGQTEQIRRQERAGEIILSEGTTQFYPEWSGDSLIFYLSNKGRDYYSQTALYVYDVAKKKSRLIQPMVRSRISLSPDGRYVYYSKKSKPNKHGSVYYDIYRYDMKAEQEDRITHFERAYNPALSPDGKRLACVTGRDGTSNLMVRNLETDSSEVLTHFDDGIEIFTLHWSPDGRRLAFDFMTTHGRDISIYDFDTQGFTSLLEGEYDSRHPYYSPDGKWLYYAADQTGIFNIYRRSLETGETELLTNTVGGAFMPALNADGKLIYVLFDDLAFKIARLDSLRSLAPEYAVYKDYPAHIPDMMEVAELNTPEPQEYKDQFSRIFLLPKLMLDYGMLKPGFYFYSSEILNRFSIFGMAALNKIWDRDLALLLEYHQWYPTIFLEFYNISRSILDKHTFYKGYEVTLDYTFYLTEALFGISYPLGAINKLRLDVSWSRYRTTTDEEIKSEGFYSSGFTYDYYQGVNFKLNWQLQKMLPSVNRETNPDNGIRIMTGLSRNYDRFLQDFGVNEDFGTLEEKFRNNYYWKIEQEGNWYRKYKIYPKLVGDFKWRWGWISKYDLDSFFNFFAGGMPGLRGYPFYGIEGRNMLSFHYTLRHPLFREQDIRLGPFNLQNAFVGILAETGNAWNQAPGIPNLGWKTFFQEPLRVIESITSDFKSDAGLQLRFSGFSFYGYPTAISLDFVYGFDKFSVVDRQDISHEYGKEWRSYLTILFGL